MSALTRQEAESICNLAAFTSPGWTFDLLAEVNRILDAREKALREEIAQETEDECPHEPDEHPEGCCEVCDYAFAVAVIARGDA